MSMVAKCSSTGHVFPYMHTGDFACQCGQVFYPQKGSVEAAELAAKVKASEETDPVNHPTHYKANGIEVIDVIEGFKLNFRLANVVKYVLRCNNKLNRLQDLRKAK